jgi:tetratricopeptide (TPR) repeat protein
VATPHLKLEDEPRPPVTLRERELETGGLVLRAATAGDAFLVRRAASAVTDLEPSTARRALRRAVEGLVDGEAGALRTGLTAYGAALEQRGLHERATDVYRTAMRLWPGEAAMTLHAARAARRSGCRDEALLLYRQAGRECGGDTYMMLLVRIGEALVSEQPAEALTAVLRAARQAGNADAVAIAREERARLVPACQAVRDLAVAAARYPDRTDRVRVLHRMAELMTAHGDLLGAREVLLAALDQAGPAHRGHSVQRLRTVARVLGDELELRRSRGRGVGDGPVMLAPSRRQAPARSAAPRLRRWRSLLPASPSTC